MTEYRKIGPVSVSSLGVRHSFRQMDEPLRELARLANGIEGVRVISIQPYREAWEIEYCAMLLEVNGHRVGFDAVMPDDFLDAPNVLVVQVDCWGFEQEEFPSGVTHDSRVTPACYGGAIGIGAGDEFGSWFPSPIRNLREAIAQVERLVAIIEELPESSPGHRLDWKGQVLYTKKFQIQGVPVHPDYFPDFFPDVR